VTPSERKVFESIVNSCDPSHFRESDIPVLVSFCTATVMSRAAANKPKQIGAWVAATNMQARLATRLRLVPSARTDPKSLARQNPQRAQQLLEPWAEHEKPYSRDEIGDE
jgi:hypothetical protein